MTIRIGALSLAVNPTIANGIILGLLFMAGTITTAILFDVLQTELGSAFLTENLKFYLWLGVTVTSVARGVVGRTIL